MTERLTGTVKWYNDQKGFGFLVPDKPGRDVFVHVRAIEAAGLKTLHEGQRVEYELHKIRDRIAAGKLITLEDA